MQTKRTLNLNTPKKFEANNYSPDNAAQYVSTQVMTGISKQL